MSEQPRPVANHHPASWDLVVTDILDMKDSYGYSTELLHHVHRDITERDTHGQSKYGVRLQPENGRDSLRDAYEESMDLVVYLRNCLSEGSIRPFTYKFAIDLMMQIAKSIVERDGT